MKLVLICGDRNWTDKTLIRSALEAFRQESGEFDVMHGCCRGVDRIAAHQAAEMALTVIGCPAEWEKYGKRAGPIRNREMLRFRPDLVWAFHDNLEASKGTKDMIEAAREAGVKVIHFTHAAQVPA